MATISPDMSLLDAKIASAPHDLTDAEREARRLLFSKAHDARLDRKELAVWEYICSRYYFSFVGEPHNPTYLNAPESYFVVGWTVLVNGRRMSDRSVQKTVRSLMDKGLLAGEAYTRASDGRGLYTEWNIRVPLYQGLRDQISESHWRRALIYAREENATTEAYPYWSPRNEPFDSRIRNLFSAIAAFDRVRESLADIVSDSNIDVSSPNGYLWARQIKSYSESVSQSADYLARCMREYERCCKDEIRRQSMTRYLASITPGQPFNLSGPDED